MEGRNIEKEINYDQIKQMEEHAKKYEGTFDKKDFLRNVSAYGQKIILLNSKNPYDVLNYLDELDLRNSRQILSELTYEEIKQILDLFTAEDKQNFYKNYSDLSLVNQFIVHDKYSSNYIKDLTFDRKVDLIDSSNKETVIASAKIYETMPEQERSIVEDSLTTSSSISALSEATNYVESNEANSDAIENDISRNESDELDNTEENNLIELKETSEEIIEETKEEIIDEMLKLEKEEGLEEQQEIDDNQIEIHKQQESNDDQIQHEESDDLISEEVHLDKNIEINENDIEEKNIENTLSTNKNLDEFKIVKQQAEQDEIEKIKQGMIKHTASQNVEEEIQIEHVKIL